ncbi:cell division inhibitor SepF [Carnobacterium iners]|uniref:Cell division protein SepF n=1 Tax=Carnobacterium iners TaxID=1073423 RepID=A0A1X7NN65_9LACT|nr:cell division protein SepF [Carnobacterium iners]SEK30771.1 cell division inhibitor SepF [Carnobacterium iners]SMH39465.1 cell division inhibitor SepF [Carnobacterium iners]
MGIKNKFSRFFELDEEDELDSIYDQGIPSSSRSGESRTSQDNDKSIPIINTKREKANNKVVSFNQQTSTKQAKITIIEPRIYSEVQEIADILLREESVVLNFFRMDEEQAKRIVDFLTGTVYALGGDIQRIGNEIFLCTPESVDIDGALTDIMREKDLY